MQFSEFDIAPVGGEPYKTQILASRDEVLETFDRNVVSGRDAIQNVKDERMSEQWSLLEGGKPIISMPRAAVIRSFVLNHMIHHRGILLVYMRLNDIPVPGMYGPSGDE
jgi:uncharacterized damage-inducible protein DinB